MSIAAKFVTMLLILTNKNGIQLIILNKPILLHKLTTH